MSEGHFEAKVERRSENKAGIFITFLVQPDDHDTALAQLRVGASVQIGWAEIVDTSVQKIEVAAPVATSVAHLPPPGYTQLADGMRCRCPKMWQDGVGNFYCCNTDSGGRGNAAVAPAITTTAPQGREETAAPSPKPRPRFSELKPSAQAGMRCDEPAFKTFVEATFPNNLQLLGGDVVAFVRDYCGVGSRGQLDDYDDAAAYWRNLEGHFQNWLTEQQHGALVR